MLNIRFFFNIFILLFLLHGQTSVAKNYINIDPNGFCSSNEEDNNVSHCNLCLISELDYFKNNKYYSDLLKLCVKKKILFEIFLSHDPKIFPRSNSPPN